jgi:hypothetical protein
MENKAKVINKVNVNFLGEQKQSGAIKVAMLDTPIDI